MRKWRNCCLIIGGSNLGIVLVKPWEPTWWYMLGAILGILCIIAGWSTPTPSQEGDA